MVRLVYYSLVVRSNPFIVTLCIQSIRSLRRHNLTIPIYVFVYGTPPNELLAEVTYTNFNLHLLGAYDSYLQNAHPKGLILAMYPTFHKFISLRHISLDDVSQILYLDCDTFFFDDVEKIFYKYQSCDWYAREEPKSWSSYLGYDPLHIDQTHLEAIAQSEKVRTIIPFNSGVCILNHHIWKRLDELMDVYLDLAWRLIVGRQLSATRWAVDEEAIKHLVLTSITDADRARALGYPSRNHWIIEQIALWLTLSHIPNFSLGIISRRHVIQNGEYLSCDAGTSERVLAHYFSRYAEDFFARFKLIEK